MNFSSLLTSLCQVQPPAQYARPTYNYNQEYVRTAVFVVPAGVDPMTAQKMMKASQVFRIYDKDCSGTLSYKEWKKAMKALGYKLPKGQKEQLFYMIDKDRSGYIDEREFCKLFIINIDVLPNLSLI